MPKSRSGMSVDLPIIYALVVVPIIWPSLFKVGPVTLEPYHVALLVLVGATVCQPRYLLMVFNIVKANVVLFSAFAAYILLLAISYMHSLESGALRELIFKQIAFIAFGACVAARMAATPNPGRTLYVGGIASLIILFVVMEISARSANASLIDALVSFGKTGDYKAWVYKFLKPAMGAFSVETVGSHYDFAASRKNNVASGILVCMVCYIVGHRYVAKAIHSQLLHYAILSIFMASMVMMLSRSVLLSFVLSLVPIAAVRIIRGRDPLFIAGAFVAATSVMLVYLIVPQGIIDGLEARFFDDTTSFESRLSQYSEAFKVIEQNMFTGVGLGQEIDEHTIHNLFLYTWLQAGVFALIAVFVFWSSIVIRIFQHVWQLLMVDTWSSNQEITLQAWIAALPIMGLLRVWVSGGGTLNFAAWFSIGVFLGLLYRHQGEQAQPARQSVASGYSMVPDLLERQRPYR
jgi:hypothetical protein